MALGNTATTIWTRPEGGGALGWSSRLAYAMSRSVQKGAQAPLWVATSDKVLAQPAGFWYNGINWWLPAWMLDDELATRLWSRWEVDANVSFKG